MKNCTNDKEFITIDEKIIGINLGWDYASEHEWGIDELHQYFGIDRKKPGFEGLRNTIIPDDIFLAKCSIYDLESKEERNVVLAYQPGMVSYSKSATHLEEIIGMIVKNNLYYQNEAGIASAWSESDFGVMVREDEGYVLENLLDAFQNKRGIIMLGGRTSPFGNSGLLLVDYSLLPEKTKKEFKEEDIAVRKEKTMYSRLEKESGVIELLKKAGKSWCSLSVQGLDDKGEPLWWLNPYDQRNHQYGWYHTEDLKLWAEDKGPVMEMRR